MSLEWSNFGGLNIVNNLRNTPTSANVARPWDQRHENSESNGFRKLSSSISCTFWHRLCSGCLQVSAHFLPLGRSSSRRIGGVMHMGCTNVMAVKMSVNYFLTKLFTPLFSETNWIECLADACSNVCPHE